MSMRGSCSGAHSSSSWSTTHRATQLKRKLPNPCRHIAPAKITIPMLLFFLFPVSFFIIHSAYDLGPPNWRAFSLSDQSEQKETGRPNDRPVVSFKHWLGPPVIPLEPNISPHADADADADDPDPVPATPDTCGPPLRVC